MSSSFNRFPFICNYNQICASSSSSSLTANMGLSKSEKKEEMRCIAKRKKEKKKKNEAHGKGCLEKRWKNGMEKRKERKRRLKVYPPLFYLI